MDLQPLSECPRFSGREGLVQARRRVRVEVVHHQHYALVAGVRPDEQVPYDVGEVHRRPLLADHDLTPGPHRVEEHEQGGHAPPLILVVVAGRLPRRAWHRPPRLGEELLARLVEADERGTLGERAVVDREHILHLRYEGRVLLRRDHPLLAEPGLEFVFLSARRTVSRLTASTWPSSTIRLASSRIDHRSRPSGGAEQAIWTRRASAAPSRARSYSRSGRLCSVA